jgi:hypothetical protein
VLVLALSLLLGLGPVLLLVSFFPFLYILTFAPSSSEYPGNNDGVEDQNSPFLDPSHPPESH